MSARFLIVVVALLSIATVALGLRVGAGGAIRAAVVMGAPLSHDHGAWQLHVQEEDGPVRTAVETPFTVTLHTRSGVQTAAGVTNVDGIGEVAFTGEPVDLVVNDDQGRELARGAVRDAVAQAASVVVERAALRASRVEGPLRMRVAVLGGALAPTEEGRVWVTVSATGEPPRNPRVDATPDLGIDVASPFALSHDPACRNAGVFSLVAHTHIGGVLFHAKDDLGREGEWYGALPIAAGAMRVSMPTISESKTVHATITTASARTIAYVEVDDAQGRSNAQIATLIGEPAHADVTLNLLSEGRSFVVVSGEPDGATNISGGTRALPVWVGPRERAPCEAELAEVSAQAFPRRIVVDGFEAKHAALAAKRKHGRRIALAGIVMGSFVESLLLLRAARAGRRAPHLSKRWFLDVFVVLALSLLGFALLFALVEWAGH